MRTQLGFGWGKGRRVIKTIIAGDALTRALAKQQTWVDRHRAVVDERPCTDTSLRVRTPADAIEVKPGPYVARSSTSVFAPTTLRMAKAQLR